MYRRAYRGPPYIAREWDTGGVAPKEVEKLSPAVYPTLLLRLWTCECPLSQSQKGQCSALSASWTFGLASAVVARAGHGSTCGPHPQAGRLNAHARAVGSLGPHRCVGGASPSDLRATRPPAPLRRTLGSFCAGPSPQPILQLSDARPGILSHVYFSPTPVVRRRLHHPRPAMPDPKRRSRLGSGTAAGGTNGG